MKTKTITIGVIIDKLDSSYQQLLWQGMCSAASEAGVMLIGLTGQAISLQHEKNTTIDNIVYDFIPGIHPDGLIIAACSLCQHCGMQSIERYLETIIGKCPTITIGSKIGTHPAIISDNYSGIKQAVHHLVIDHNFNKFAYLSGPPGNPDSIERLKLIKQELYCYGLNLEPSLIENGNFSYIDGKAASIKLLNKNSSFDVVFSANDDMALGFMDICKTRNIEIPQDIRVIGMDNSLHGQCCTPSLSTIDTSIFIQGKKAIESICALINNGSQKDIIIPSSLVKRDSCGCSLKEASSQPQAAYESERFFASKFLNSERQSLLLHEFEKKISNSSTINDFLNTVSAGLSDLGINDFVLMQYRNSHEKKSMHYKIGSLNKGICVFNGIPRTIKSNAESIYDLLRIKDMAGWIITPILYNKEYFCIMAIASVDGADFLSTHLRVIFNCILKNIQANEMLKEITEKLEHLAEKDELTGLYNRHGFLHHAESKMTTAVKNSNDFALFYADLSDIKFINNKFGFAEGDQMIRYAASIFIKAFRQNDIIGRIDGDKFAVACVIKKNYDMSTIQNRFEQIILRFNSDESQKWHIAMTIGSCTMQQTGHNTIYALLQHSLNLINQKKAEKKGLKTPI